MNLVRINPKDYYIFKDDDQVRVHGTCWKQLGSEEAPAKKVLGDLVFETACDDGWFERLRAFLVSDMLDMNRMRVVLEMDPAVPEDLHAPLRPLCLRQEMLDRSEITLDQVKDGWNFRIDPNGDLKWHRPGRATPSLETLERASGKVVTGELPDT